MDLITMAAHVHESAGFAEEFKEIFFSPAHWVFEAVFSVLFDFIVLTVIYGLIIKKFIIPRLRKSIHADIDREHGLEHGEHIEQKDSI